MVVNKTDVGHCQVYWDRHKLEERNVSNNSELAQQQQITTVISTYECHVVTTSGHYFYLVEKHGSSKHKRNYTYTSNELEKLRKLDSLELCSKRQGDMANKRVLEHQKKYMQSKTEILYLNLLTK